MLNESADSGPGPILELKEKVTCLQHYLGKGIGGDQLGEVITGVKRLIGECVPAQRPKPKK